MSNDMRNMRERALLHSPQRRRYRYGVLLRRETKAYHTERSRQLAPNIVKSGRLGSRLTEAHTSARCACRALCNAFGASLYR
jgi:hypothetical protein